MKSKDDGEDRRLKALEEMVMVQVQVSLEVESRTWSTLYVVAISGRIEIQHTCHFGTVTLLQVGSLNTKTFIS